MKFLCYIFSLYILALSIVPCNDHRDCENKAQIVLVTATDHGNHQHETEFCSPFCTCYCCGTQTISQFVQNWNLSLPVVASKSPSVYQSVFIDGFFAPIWQPPKIA